MHKGRLYELEPRARTFTAPYPYPNWYAKRYNVLDSTVWFGNIAASVDSSNDFIEFDSIDAAAGRLRYSGTITNSAGKTVILRLEWLLIANNTDLAETWSLLVDGVEQLTPGNRFILSGRWDAPSGDASLVPGSGPDLAFAPLHTEAEPY